MQESTVEKYNRATHMRAAARRGQEPNALRYEGRGFVIRACA